MGCLGTFMCVHHMLCDYLIRWQIWNFPFPLTSKLRSYKCKVFILLNDIYITQQLDYTIKEYKKCRNHNTPRDTNYSAFFFSTSFQTPRAYLSHRKNKSLNIWMDAEIGSNFEPSISVHLTGTSTKGIPVISAIFSWNMNKKNSQNISIFKYVRHTAIHTDTKDNYVLNVL